MLVQRRDNGAVTAYPMIKVKVSHRSYQHEIFVPAQATFGMCSIHLLCHVINELDIGYSPGFDDMLDCKFVFKCIFFLC